LRDQPRSTRGRRWVTQDHPSVPDTSNLPAVYYLFILGSGGHTTEMLEMVRRSFRPQPNQHRRYVVSTGDTDSLDRVAKLEAQILRVYGREQAGTRDSHNVPRARRVHQPLWTAPLSCLHAGIACVGALTREPDVRPRARHGTQFKYPHVVVTNGPATGFVVCAVAHLLRVFYLVPHRRSLKLVYVESWARSRALSLTGKLFLWSGIADLFCVQHEELAERINGGWWGPDRVVNVGLVGAPPPATGG
jgi:beta-1,4-N-acetylglucosaminyltransferase